MFEIDWLRLGLTTVVGVVIAILWGNRGVEKKFADDLVLTLTKAHLGKLPKGQYDNQYVYTKHLPREQLCTPLSEDVLRNMVECPVIEQHEMTCRTVRSRVGFKRGTISLSVSVHFRGQKVNGEPVAVHVNNALLLATVERDKVRGWTLTSLRPISMDKPLT